MIQHKKIKPTQTLRSIIGKFPDIKDIVKFALFCAEDVYELNYETTKPLAKKCIDLVKQWLIDPKLIDIGELALATSTFTSINGAYAANAANAAVYTAKATYYIATLHANASNTIYTTTSIYATTYAVDAAGRASNANTYINRNYMENMKRYKYIASTYLSKSNIQNKPMMSKVIDKEDYTSILALLDELEESQEDIIQQLPDGSLRLNLPKGHDIIGKNKVDLAKKIVLPRNSWIVDWLQRLY